MKRELQDILKRYTADACALYGDRLHAVVLYGFYGRGDYREDSDIDIMILVDMDDEAIRSRRKMLSYLTYDFNDANDILIMSIAVNISHFTRWLRAYPFYNNVRREGMELYGEADRNAG